MATPFMNLTLPTVGVTIGPTWAANLNTVLTFIDSHNHSSGQGALIPTSGLNINSDLSFGSYNATVLRTTRFASQAAALALTSDKECVYSVAGNLYYNNSSGTAVQITSGTGLNLASVGTIGGDYGGGGVTASVTYNNTTKVYAFLQAASSTAKMAMGEINLFETATGTNAVTIKSPTSLASAYSVTFPAALQAYTGFVRMTSAGVIQNDVQPDAASIEVSGSTLQIKDLGVITAKINNLAVTTAKIADSNVTTAKIADGNVTQAKRVALGEQVTVETVNTTTSGTAFLAGPFISITTTGRPIWIGLYNTNTSASIGQAGGANYTISAGGNGAIYVQFFNITTSAQMGMFVAAQSSATVGSVTTVPVSSFCGVYPIAAGTYIIQVRIASAVAGAAVNLNYYKLCAYEL
jgi:hypothetical protein